MLGADPAAPESLRHPLLDQVAARLPQLQVAFDTAELQAELGAVDDTGRFFVLKLVQVKVNGHDAIDGIAEDATSPRRRRNPPPQCRARTTHHRAHLLTTTSPSLWLYTIRTGAIERLIHS